MNWDFDVIIVGGGCAGNAAAIEAHEAGANVIILEAAKALGGASVLSAGVFFASNTSVQRARGFDDSADAQFRYIMDVQGWDINSGLIRTFADRSGPTLEWLISLGACFPSEYLTFSGAEYPPRGHPSSGLGSTVGQALVNAVGARGIQTALNTRVEKLLVENGHVVGVTAGGMDLRAPSTLIATGNFANNRAMIERLLPTAHFHGDKLRSIFHDVPTLQGDGIRMAEEIGAEVVGIDQACLYPVSNHLPQPTVIEPPSLPAWVMVVNRKGRRFMKETAPYTYSGDLINAQEGRVAYAIFDEPTLATYANDLKYLDPYHCGIPFPTWEESVLRGLIASGRILAADTIPELAQKLGIDPRTLQQTVTRYNDDMRQGVDTEFLKEMEDFPTISVGPFYASEVRGSCIANINAGLNIDIGARVLDEHGCPIPGLFAAGEVLGCTSGKHYVAGGMGLGMATVFGRIAGVNAAANAKRFADDAAVLAS